MTSARGWILLSHSHQEYPAIGEAEMLDALPAELRDGPRERVRITGTVPVGDDAADADWAALQREQAAQVRARDLIELRKERGIAYFGRTLLPLAMDLGYRLEGWAAKSRVFLYHTRTESWCWPSRAESQSSITVQLRHNLPLAPISIPGDVVVRVAVSQAISPEDTRAVVPAPVAEVDVNLDRGPGRDALATLEELERVVAKFDEALGMVKEKLPRAEHIHLFAAVPAGLAFRMGNIVNHKVHPPIVAYQFVRRAPVKYQRAFVLGADPVMAPGGSAGAPVKILFLAAEPKLLPADVSRRVQPRVRIGEELHDIYAELRRGEHRDRFDKLSQPRLAVQIKDIQPYVRGEHAQILHFSGHGLSGGHLIFEDAAGGCDPVHPEAMRRLFQLWNDDHHIRCAVFNACYSNALAMILTREPAVISCAVGTVDRVSDRAALAFSTGFYGALVDGLPLQKAFDAGCVQVGLASHAEADIFKLSVADESLRDQPIFAHHDRKA